MSRSAVQPDLANRFGQGIGRPLFNCHAVLARATEDVATLYLFLNCIMKLSSSSSANLVCVAVVYFGGLELSFCQTPIPARPLGEY